MFAKFTQLAIELRFGRYILQRAGDDYTRILTRKWAGFNWMIREYWTNKNRRSSCSLRRRLPLGSAEVRRVSKHKDTHDSQMVEKRAVRKNCRWACRCMWLSSLLCCRAWTWIIPWQRLVRDITVTSGPGVKIPSLFYGKSMREVSEQASAIHPGAYQNLMVTT